MRIVWQDTFGDREYSSYEKKTEARNMLKKLKERDERKHISLLQNKKSI